MLKRIAVIADEFPSVSETFVVDHVVGLVRRGLKVTVLCACAREAALPSIFARAGDVFDVVSLATSRDGRLGSPVRTGASLIWAALRSPGALRSALGRSLLVRVPLLSRAIRATRPAAVHAHFASNGLSAALAMPSGTPLVVDFHGWDFTALPATIGWAPLRRALRGATLVAHSGFAADRIHEGLGRSPRRVALGVDLRTFAAPVRASTWQRPLRLLCVGRLVRPKGHAVAIEALRALRADGAAEAVLRIMGDGPERVALERLARDVGVGSQVTFAGPASHAEVAREMFLSDMLLVPSVRGEDGWEEAFGRVALEGLAAGLPVLVSNCGGLPETVGPAGWTVPAGDALALARCIRQVTSGVSPADCAETSRARAECFPIERTWDEYAAVAREAFAAGTARRASPE